MKYLYPIFLILLFTSCKRTQGDIEITGTAPGVIYGNIIVRDIANNTILRTDIQNGKFQIRQFFQQPGFYKMLYATKATKGSNREIELYLEPGTYTIEIDQTKINDYPEVTSSSQAQTQLSAYNAINDSLRHAARQRAIDINNQMKGVNTSNDTRSSSQIDTLTKLQTAELKANQVDGLAVFKLFMDKYPDNEVAAHIMRTLDYQNDPVAYYKIYQTFSAAAQNSPDGRELGEKLKDLAKLAPGSPAPAIAGTTPDGKEINIKALNKKIILLDFWRSTNGSSRDNHGQIISQLMQLEPKGFGVLSVSLDTDREKWLSAIELDQMKWPQISDLQGDESPNGAIWGIRSIPAYYLLDGNGKIIARIAQFADVPAAVDEYLAKH